MGTGVSITKLPNEDRSLQDGCVFCDIVKGKGTRKLYEDELLVAFRDIDPAAKHHLQVIPEAHIVSTHHLQATSQDKQLVIAMLAVGKRLIHELDPTARTKFGFHDPPFLSVPHLHLHCFALPHSPAWKGFKYQVTKTGSLGFVSVDQVLERLRRKEQHASDTAPG